MMNAHEILGVSKFATKDEIKSSYRKLSLKFHPDLNKAPNATEKFREINSAYEYAISHIQVEVTRKWKVDPDFYKPSKEPPPPPKEKPKPKVNPLLYDYYFPSYRSNISLAERYIQRDIKIFFDKGMKDEGEPFIITLRKGTVLPTTINITNLKEPLKIRIEPAWGF